MPSASTSALLKTLLIPPLIALTFYLSTTYLLLPLWRRHRERSSYSLIPQHLLPDSLLPSSTSSHHPSNQAYDASGNPNTAALSRLSRLIGSVASVAHRATGGGLGMRRGSEGSMRGFGIGDEELEEGVGVMAAGGGGGGAGGGGGGRLSRDLEGGFMSDSESEEDGDGRRGR